MLNKLKIRMLLTNSAILFSIVLFITVFVYLNVSINTLQNTDSDLVNRSYQLRRYLPIIENATTKTQSPELFEEYAAFEKEIDAASFAYCIWDQNERLIANDASTYNTDVLSGFKDIVFTANPMAVRTVGDERGIFYIYDYYYAKENIRLAVNIVSDDEGNMRIIEMLSNMDSNNDMSNRLLSTLILTGIVGIALSFLIGYWITGRAMKPIQESIQKQNQFVADASHELRTPITVVRTNLDAVLASKDETVESQAKWLLNAYKETESMEKLVSDLLLLAKSDLNQNNIVLQKVNFNEVVASIVERMKELAGNKAIQIIYYAPPHPITVNGDRGRLAQLIVILLDNAVSYSYPNTKIKVRLNKMKNYAELSVEDEGIGINADELDMIFTRFYRTDRARSRSEGGTGLGLSIAKWIVEAHNGTIYATSEKDKGTIITVRIPQEGEG